MAVPVLNTQSAVATSSCFSLSRGRALFGYGEDWVLSLTLSLPMIAAARLSPCASVCSTGLSRVNLTPWAGGDRAGQAPLTAHACREAVSSLLSRQQFPLQFTSHLHVTDFSYQLALCCGDQGLPPLQEQIPFSASSPGGSLVP